MRYKVGEIVKVRVSKLSETMSELHSLGFRAHSVPCLGGKDYMIRITGKYEPRKKEERNDDVEQTEKGDR